MLREGNEFDANSSTCILADCKDGPCKAEIIRYLKRFVVQEVFDHLCRLEPVRKLKACGMSRGQLSRAGGGMRAADHHI